MSQSQARISPPLQGQLEALFALRQGLFHVSFPGHIPAAPHRAQQVALVVEEGGLVHVQVEELPLHVAPLVEPGGGHGLQGEGVRIPTDLPEGVPPRVLRVGRPLPKGEVEVRLSQGFLRVLGVEQHLRLGPVHEEEPFLEVLGPEQVRDVVAEGAKQGGDLPVASFAFPEGLFVAPTGGDVDEEDHAAEYGALLVAQGGASKA